MLGKQPHKQSHLRSEILRPIITTIGIASSCVLVVISLSFFLLPPAAFLAVTCSSILLVLILALFKLVQLDKHFLHLETIIGELAKEMDFSVPETTSSGSPVQRIFNTSQGFESLLSRYLDTISREYSQELLHKQMEFKVLQNQINPHFLYNTLDSIRGNALAIDAIEIADMTEALALFFRYCISQKDDFVSIEDELSNIRNYFHIQRYRFGNRFDLQVLCDTPAALSNFVIPKLILQPLVENGIYHGLEPKAGSGTITVRVTATSQHLIITVSDDGRGMSPEQLTAVKAKIAQGQTSLSKQKTGSIALNNVHQRIQMFFGEAYGLHMFSTPNMGTKAELFLPALTSPPKLVSKKGATD